MAAVMLEVIPSFFRGYSKATSLFLQTDMKNTIRVKNTVLLATMTRFHVLLIGNIKELLQKLDAFCFIYQHVDCLYALLKYHSSGKFIVESGQLFNNLQRAVHFNQHNRRVDRMPSIAKKGFLRKKYKKHLLSSFQKTKSTQTSGSVFADRIEQGKKTKFELELLRIVDCFLDGHGNYTSNLKAFKLKSL